MVIHLAKIISKLSYKPSLSELRKAAKSVEYFEGYEKLSFKHSMSEPIIFKNLSLEEMEKVLKKYYVSNEQFNIKEIRQAFSEIPELHGRTIQAYMGKGGYSIALLLDNNKVLKKTLVALKDQSVSANNTRNVFNSTLEANSQYLGTIGDYAYSLQEFGIPKVNNLRFKWLTKKLKNKGYTFDADWDLRQCARFNDEGNGFLHRINPFGQTKVVDLGCVHPPTEQNLHTLA